MFGVRVLVTYWGRATVPIVPALRSPYVRSSVLSGISLGPVVHPAAAAITPLPDDLRITYREKGRIEISCCAVACVPPFLCGSTQRLERGRELTCLDD